MKEARNVLITAASRRVALVRLFRRALEPLGGQVITVDHDPCSPALFFAHSHYQVPLVLDPAYLPTLRQICRQEAIGLIIPTIDQELQLWAQAAPTFDQEGIHVSISPPETIRICNDKEATAAFFQAHALPFAPTFRPGTLPPDSPFPLFIKPRQGRGSVHCFPIRNPRELAFFSDYVTDPVIQHFLPGQEFTVDALFDRTGRLIRAVPRFRLVVRSGVSDRGRTFHHPGLSRWIETIGGELPFRGAVNLQGKIHEDRVTFFEINPRFSGGIQLSMQALEESFPELLMQEHLGQTLSANLEHYQDGLLMASYEESLFLHDECRELSSPWLLEPPILPRPNRCS